MLPPLQQQATQHQTETSCQGHKRQDPRREWAGARFFLRIIVFHIEFVTHPPNGVDEFWLEVVVDFGA